MKRIVKEVAFYVIAFAVMMPAPILLLAWMTGRTIREVVLR